MTLHSRPASPDALSNVETDHPRMQFSNTAPSPRARRHCETERAIEGEALYCTPHNGARSTAIPRRWHRPSLPRAGAAGGTCTQLLPQARRFFHTAAEKSASSQVSGEWACAASLWYRIATRDLPRVVHRFSTARPVRSIRRRAAQPRAHAGAGCGEEDQSMLRRSDMARCASRASCFSRRAWRLSQSFLPRATAISTFAREPSK